ncbi:fasciclin domain-containing protein [Rhodococcus phenolicus]|uniref:fasciclin domain-containing protein n=1 Tax=Rhodococcus phenolicus TaxID=263849 RepID=UPI00083319D3|nr:fasciclin domain-containing protein [Rhodococcus phenolicus]
MAIRTRKSMALIGIGAAAVMGLSACSSDDSDTTMESATSAATSAMESATATGTAEATASGPVGPGCAAYAEQVPSGPGSLEAIAQEPVATAAGNVPVLTTLTAALSGQLNPDVNLVDTLNGGEFTVFAPVDDAFAQVDPATVETLKTDSAMLTDILTYHVVPGQIPPADIAGEKTTVEGGTVTVTGSGENWKVNEANVICGGIETENATVYLIDGVLLPPQ